MLFELLTIQKEITPPLRKNCMLLCLLVRNVTLIFLVRKLLSFLIMLLLKALLQKHDSKPRLIKWVLLLQEFDIEIVDKPGAQNLVANHLGRLENGEKANSLTDQFSYETLYPVTTGSLPWYADIVNYLVTKEFPTDSTQAEKEKIRAQAKYYLWDEPYLWKFCSDQIIRQCVDDNEIHSILTFFILLRVGDTLVPGEQLTKS